MHVIVNGWFVGQETTGSGQYLHHLLDHLPGMEPRHRWSLLVPSPPAPLLAAWRARWPGVDVIAVAPPPGPKSLGKVGWEQLIVPHCARRLRGDVLWTPYWAASAWQPCPTVVTIHDLIPYLLPAYRGGLGHRLYNGLVRWTARRCAATLTVSQSARRDIVEHLGIPSERVYVALHGPNLEGSTAPDPVQLVAARLRYGLPEHFFLYLGGFDLRKNVATVVRAYRRYLDKGGDPAYRLVIAGKLPLEENAFIADPRKTAAECDLGEQIIFCGWIDDVDKPALYALAAGYFFPSLYEGFGMTILEAMQAGTPVITSKK
jgi:glycosyltransferase involved in cell wall biosynthesis